jgi:hypothetical protein
MNGGLRPIASALFYALMPAISGKIPPSRKQLW